jgi:hypothetical protein
MENLGTTAHERKKGQRNVGQGNKTKVMSLIPLPIIPLPTPLDSTFFSPLQSSANGCNLPRSPRSQVFVFYLELGWKGPKVALNFFS